MADIFPKGTKNGKGFHRNKTGRTPQESALYQDKN
jgi:hypothetical protein